jgi:hypothetical protein
MARLGPIVAASLLGAGLATQAAAAPEVSAGGAKLSAAQRILRAEPAAVVRELLDAKSLLLDADGEIARAYVLFDRPLDRVYALLSETVRQREYRNELEELATVQRLSDGHVDEQQIRILFVKIGYRLRYRLDPKRHRIAWELDPSLPNPMRRVDGSWELYEMDAGRTLGRLSSAVDVSDELPAFVEETITRTTLPSNLERCRLWVNADGAAAP